MSDEQASCAHCNVVLKHKDYPDGTRSDYWECADGCGKQFWPDNSMEEATAVFSRETYDRMMKEQDETIAILKQENALLRSNCEGLKQVLALHFEKETPQGCNPSGEPAPASSAQREELNQ